MASEIESNRCSTCKKNEGNCNCRGCQKFFCVKHFNEHRQQLSIDFDRDVVRSHDELLEQIHQTKEPNHSSDDLLSRIDRWEQITINKVKQAAEGARDQLIQLLDSEKETLTKEFERLTTEVRRQREEEDFAEDSVQHLQQQINKLKNDFEQLTRPNINQVIVVENDRIDWHRIIYVSKQQKDE